MKAGRRHPPALTLSAVPTALTRTAAQWTADHYGEPVHLLRPVCGGHPAAVRESDLAEGERGRVLVTLYPREATL